MMMRLHCFVSCVGEALKRAEADERPFYFGVWDAPFFIGEKYELLHHAPGSDQAFFCEWFQRLYGATIHEWYDRSSSKQANISHLIELVEGRPELRNVLVMLDLSELPEREHKLVQSPFPHYVMLRPTKAADHWLVEDPDFSWEGAVPKERVLAAVASPSVAGGYYFDEGEIHTPDPSAVRDYFEVCSRAENDLTAAIGASVTAHLEGRTPAGVPGLTEALREVPTLALRKYAYEQAFAYFFRAHTPGITEQEFLAWCDVGETLVKAYTTIQYRAMKLAMTRDGNLAGSIFEVLEQQGERETRIKRRLAELFRAWCGESQLRESVP